MEAHLHLGGHDPGQGGLAQAGRTGEEEVVGRLAALARRFEDDRQVLLQLGLAHEVGEGAGTEPDLVGQLRRFEGFGIEQLVSHGSATSQPL